MSRVENRKNNGKKTSRFMRGYLIYVAVLAVLLIALFFYVRGIMVEYENSVPEKYIEAAMNKGGVIAGYLDKNCFSGGLSLGKEASDEYLNTVKNAKLEIKHSVYAYDATKPVYNVLADGKPFITVGLSEGKSKTKLGAIVIPEWKLDTCILRNPDSETESIRLNKNGKLDYNVSIPEGFTLLLSGHEYKIAEGTDKAAIKDFAYIAEYVKVPEMNKLSFKDICMEPAFTALNNAGAVIEAQKLSGGFEFAPSFAESTEAKKTIESFANPIAMGEIWSKFMTNDVGGTNRGLDTVLSACRILPGSQLYTLAKNWAKSVDITFVSIHTLHGFTNEKVSNFVKYNDNFVSCDVYFEKNMTLKTGAKRTDVFNNRMCFVYISDKAVAEPGWYLTDIISIQ